MLVVYEEKTCECGRPGCPKLFVPTHGKQKYADEKCRTHVNNIRERERRLKVKAKKATELPRTPKAVRAKPRIEQFCLKCQRYSSHAQIGKGLSKCLCGRIRLAPL